MQISTAENLVARNPATGEIITQVKMTRLEEIKDIYVQSRDAQKVWASKSIKERMESFKRLRLEMVERMEEIAEVISKSTGKVLTEAITADIMPTIDAIMHIEKHSERGLKRKKVKTPLLLIGKKSYVEWMPRGAVLIISPWNYPLNLAMVPVLSALAGGNSVILKPSEVTPLVGEIMGELFRGKGFPSHIVQVVQGGKEIGEALTSASPDYIFFTGSVQTGKKIGEAAARNLIPSTLELGGKDPMIIFEDANLERAAKGAVWGAFTNSGQVCMSTERLYVEQSVYHKFLKLIREEAGRIKQGVSVDDDLGSMTSEAQKEILKVQITEAIHSGAILETGVHPDEWDERLFLPLMILTNVSPEMSIMKEESFGPVLPIMTFETMEEVIELANSTRYGLNASVWSRDLEKAKMAAGRLLSGAVVINDVITSVANHHLPFGGVKESGIGRYHGEQGIQIFCHEKAVLEDSGKRRTEVQWFPYEGKYPLFIKLFKSYFGKRKNYLNFVDAYIRLLRK
ncbi:aldehyde dehydrogenase family protein [Falsibacillus pallidus]|uniref:aldehyde dehydrogenase family protein n=1 Tax=Falsibacillus pallidus TaxID=493781 RepID=UPI003D998378